MGLFAGVVHVALFGDRVAQLKILVLQPTAHPLSYALRAGSLPLVALWPSPSILGKVPITLSRSLLHTGAWSLVRPPNYTVPGPVVLSTVASS